MKFRKKPVVIDAVQWNGLNVHEMHEFLGKSEDRTMVNESTRALVIDTLEGAVTANIGDWIIKGVKGEFYPCKPDIFEKTYESTLAEITPL